MDCMGKIVQEVIPFCPKIRDTVYLGNHQNSENCTNFSALGGAFKLVFAF